VGIFALLKGSNVFVEREIEGEISFTSEFSPLGEGGRGHRAMDLNI